MPCRTERLVVPHRQWTRTDKAHIALRYIDELRQLVKATFAQEPPDRRNARIVADLEHWPAYLIQMRQVGDFAFGVWHHGAELVQTKSAFVDAYALLYEEHGSRGAHLNKHRDRN